MLLCHVTCWINVREIYLSVSIHKLKSNLGEIGDILEADQDDLDFLKKFLNNPALKNILQVMIQYLMS